MIPRTPSPRDERGQGSLEAVGIILLATILVASTVGVVVQASPNLRETVSYQICKIVNVFSGGGCDEPGELRTEDDRIPDEPCVVTSDSGSVQVTGSFVVSVTVGKSFLIEELSDGTFRITEVDLGNVGIGVGPGIDVSITLDGKKYGVTAIASADALLAGKKGKTWYADDRDGVQDIMEGILADQILDQVGPDIPGPEDIPIVKDIPIIGDIPGPPNPVRALLEQLIAGTPDPDEQFIEGGIEGDAQAAVSELVVGAGAQIKAGAYLGGKETPDGYTAYYRGTLSGEAWGAVMGRDATAIAGGEVLWEVNIGKDGKPTSVSLTTGVTLDADAQNEVQTTDDQQYTETKLTVPLTGDPLRDAQILAAVSGEPFSLLNFIDTAKDEGTVSRNTYTQDPNTYGLNVTGELLGDYGGSASVDFTNRQLESSEYWNGSAMVENPTCTS